MQDSCPVEQTTTRQLWQAPYLTILSIFDTAGNIPAADESTAGPSNPS